MSKQHKNFKIIKEDKDGKDGLAMARFDLVPGEDLVWSGVDRAQFEANEAEQQDEEYYRKLFRCLSAATTQSRYFDFSGDGVLKAAVPMFEGKTIFANHRMDVTQWKGFTEGAVWDDKNTPKGVNAVFVLDRTVDPNLTRGVETGALKSASATIWFEYVRSHPDLKWFYDKLGEEVDGQIVRFVVTRIHNVGEMSIVWEGEDRYAKSFEAGDEPEELMKGEESMKFSNEFLTRFSLSGEPAAEDLETAILEKIGSLETKVGELEADAQVGKKHLEDTRENAVTLYKAAKGEDAKDSFITNVIEKADLETAQSFVDEYQETVEAAVPLACPKCGEKLSRRSSRGSETEGKKTVDVSNYKIK